MTVLPWDDATARACGLDWLLAQIAPAGALGRAAAAELRAFGPGEEAAARAAIAEIATVAGAAADGALEALRLAIASVPDPAIAVARARRGETLADADAFELLRFLDEVAGIVRSAREGGVPVPPGLDELAPALRSALAPGRTPQRGFYLSDAFSPELAAARQAVAVAQTRYDAEYGRISAAIARFAGREHLREGEFVLMRDTFAAPLPAVVRVLREAPTFVLCERVLDEGALAALAALDDAHVVAAACEDAVRARLTMVVAAQGVALDAACAVLGRLDVVVSRAAFARRHALTVPTLVPAATLAFTAARYLPLAMRSRRYVPLDLDLAGACVLTGPNMGGKSSALRTCGFIAACVVLGLPVSATSARAGLFARIVWLGPLGDDAQERGLSSFGSEIVRVRDVLEGGVAHGLMLVDEFARTTTPREGRALLVALVETLRAHGALVFAATHAAGVAALAGAHAFAVVGLRSALPVRAPGSAPLALGEALAQIEARIDYRIEGVPAGVEAAGDAVALAGALGIDPALAARAHELSALE